MNKCTGEGNKIWEGKMITRLFDFFFFFLSITENIKIEKKKGNRTKNQRQYSKRCFEFVEEKNWDNSNSLGLLEIREKLVVSPILIVCFNSLSFSAFSSPSEKS